MTSKQFTNALLKTVAILVLTALSLYFFWEIRSIFAYVAIAFVVAMIGRPLVIILKEKIKIPTYIGAAITLFLFVFVILLCFTGFVSLVLKEPFHFINNYKNLNDFDRVVDEQLFFLNLSIDQLNLPVVKDYLKNVISDAHLHSVSSYFNSSIDKITSYLIDLFSVLFIAFFFLKDKDLINNFIISLVPEKDEEKFEHILTDVKSLLSRYFIGLSFQVLCMFTIYFLILLTFDINYAAVIALICAMLNLLPYIGPLMGGFLMGMLTIGDMNSSGYNMHDYILPNTLWILFLFLIAQILDNLILQPLIYSKSVKSGPLEIFIVILIGGILFNVIGVVIAVPIYTVIRVVLKEFYSDHKFVQSITKNL